MTDVRAVRLALTAAKYRAQLAEAQELIRILAMDWSDRCDHPDDCTCSMAQAIRYTRQLESEAP